MDVWIANKKRVPGVRERWHVTIPLDDEAENQLPDEARGKGFRCSSVDRSPTKESLVDAWRGPSTPVGVQKGLADGWLGIGTWGATSDL